MPAVRISAHVVVSLIAIGVVALTGSQALASETTASPSEPTAPSPDFTPDERAVLNRGFKWIEGRSDHGDKVFCQREVALGPRISQPLCGTAEQLKNLAKLTIRDLHEGRFDSFQGARGVSGQRGVQNGTNRQLCGSGRPDVALTSCTRVIEDQREPPEVVGTARRNRASLYQDNGNLAGAIEDYTKALELDFRDVKLNAKTYVNRGRAYVDSGDDSSALADYDKALMLDPSLATAYLNRADLYMKRGDSERALVDLDEVVRLSPNADYTQAIASDPKLVNAYINRGVAYPGKSNWDAAIADFTTAIGFDSAPRVTAYLDRGLALQSKGDRDGAMADFEQVIRLKPDDVEALRHHGFLRQAKGEFAAAAADYGRVIALAPNDSEAHRGRGYAELSQGNYDAAISDLTEAVTLNPNDGLAYKFRSMAYAGKHDVRHAASDDQTSARLGR